MNKKGLVLLSGGLDSALAAKMILDQGLELEAINFTMSFHADPKDDGDNAARRSSKNLGIGLKLIDVSQEYLEVVKSPKHGYGANLNPCIDCRIFMLKKAKEYMEEIQASFIVTGEVVGERPMSQRSDMIRHIEKKAGLKDLIVRPLSAKLLEPTLAEKKGIVDREKLLDLRGRSRRPQLEMARRFNIVDYSTPAGGCLLTDPGFAERAKDLLAHGAFTLENIRLLKLGRHFRLNAVLKLVVGRNKNENSKLLDMALEGDIFFDAKGIPGPIGMLRGEGIKREDLEVSASIVSRYSDTNGGEVTIIYWRHPDKALSEVAVVPAAKETLNSIRI